MPSMTFRIFECDYIPHPPDKWNLNVRIEGFCRVLTNVPLEVGCWLPRPASASPHMCSHTGHRTSNSCVPVCCQIWGLVLMCDSSVANELIGNLDFLLCDLLRFQERGGQDSSSCSLCSQFTNKSQEIRGCLKEGPGDRTGCAHWPGVALDCFPRTLPTHVLMGMRFKKMK